MAPPGRPNQFSTAEYDWFFERLMKGYNFDEVAEEFNIVFAPEGSGRKQVTKETIRHAWDAQMKKPSFKYYSQKAALKALSPKRRSTGIKKARAASVVVSARNAFVAEASRVMREELDLAACASSSVAPASTSRSIASTSTASGASITSSVPLETITNPVVVWGIDISAQVHVPEAQEKEAELKANKEGKYVRTAAGLKLMSVCGAAWMAHREQCIQYYEENLAPKGSAESWIDTTKKKKPDEDRPAEEGEEYL
ncbi:hypothetical protein NBRC10512v2_000980 [Rhodotorula toruloides]|uniref:RHTO0S02e06150g1_1 n=2 Tax=Rhodotorula toruloides TaxID=5286 RepID=A0A061AGM0_RHOTO|nr:RHTO0S02e06150g1_1 [Rhodotorula toruloides]